MTAPLRLPPAGPVPGYRPRGRGKPRAL